MADGAGPSPTRRARAMAFTASRFDESEDETRGGSSRRKSLPVARPGAADGSLWVISRVRGSGTKWNEGNSHGRDEGEGEQVAKTWELGQVVDAAVDVAQSVSDELLEDMREASVQLLFWEKKAQLRRGKRRFMLVQRGPWALVTQLYQRARLAYKGLNGDAKMEQRLMLEPQWQIEKRVESLQKLKRQLAIALGQVHMLTDALVSTETENEARGVLQGTISGIRIALEELVQASEDARSAVRHPPFPTLLRTRTFTPEKPRTSLLKMRSSGSDAAAGPEELCSNSELYASISRLKVQFYKAQVAVAKCIHTCKKPSKLQQNWILCTGISACAGASLYFAFTHSRLNGSDDLDRWVAQARSSLSTFFSEHVRTPFVTIYEELTRSFSPSSMEAQTVKESQESLQRMLEAFVAKNEIPVHEAVDGELMPLVMKRYEQELMQPIKNLFAGALVQMLLIQIQKLKVETESALMQMDQILLTNQINFALMAATPAVLGMAGLMALIKHLVFKSPAAQRDAMRQELRMLLIEVDRALHHECDEESASSEEKSLQIGLLLFTLNYLYRAAYKHRIAMGLDEWRSVRVDVVELAAPVISTESKIAIVQRMSRLYKCFSTHNL